MSISGNASLARDDDRAANRKIRHFFRPERGFTLILSVPLQAEYSFYPIAGFQLKPLKCYGPRLMRYRCLRDSPMTTPKTN